MYEYAPREHYITSDFKDIIIKIDFLSLVVVVVVVVPLYLLLIQQVKICFHVSVAQILRGKILISFQSTHLMFHRLDVCTHSKFEPRNYTHKQKNVFVD